MEWFESTRNELRLWISEKFPTLHEQAQVEVSESRSRKVFFLHQLPPGEEQPSVKINNTISSNKYTILTFVPRNLFEQFHRVANFYFLGIFIMQVLIDSPVSPYTSGLPLCFVVGLTAVKQAYEDWLRYREDQKENTKTIYVVRSGVLVQDRCMNIRPGDIVRVSEGETVPADLVLISSSDATYHAYYSTAALDGESNLKEAICLKKTSLYTSPAQITQIRCYCEVQAPNHELYRFAGRAVFNYGVGGENEEIFPLTPDQFIFRGSILRNTEWIYGLAVYTGKETKMVQNWKGKRQKRSCAEHSMNRFLVFYLILLFSLSGLSLVTEGIWNFHRDDEWYRELLDPTTTGATLATFFSFLVIYNYVIPISLYVTVEMQRFVSAFYISWDEKFFHRTPEGEDLQAKVNCSDINDELGQVKFLLSDKTGTLTENEMVFKSCSIGGVRFDIIGNQLVRCDTKAELLPHHDPAVYQFFLAMSLCHTVKAKVDRRPKYNSQEAHLSGEFSGDSYTLSPAKLSIKYTASSPDELALVEAAKNLGVAYIGHTESSSGMVQVQTCTKTRNFSVEDVIEFDSVRKRQSIILKDENGSYLILTKGADSHVLPLVTEGHLKQVQQSVLDFSMDGFRTLILCKKLVSPEEGQLLVSEMKSAKSIVNDTERSKALERIHSKIESNLKLMGATAVEDKLQTKVSETMSNLREAGILIWVLTGDKEETALAVSRMAKHIDPGTKIFKISGENTIDIGTSIADAIRTMSPGAELGGPIRKNSGAGWAVLIPGAAVTVAIRDHKKILQTLLLKIRPESVLCCRMAPIQKAQIVKLVKNFAKEELTLAIGDGANDVSMIQEAHVGVGIFGKEGRAAAQNADYAIARFHHVERLLLFHGRNFYNRLANLIQYFFYKNLTYVMPQILFQLKCGFSQMTLYDGVYLTLYNTAFTAMPILFYGFLERDLSAESMKNKPYIYTDNRNNRMLNLKSFLSWTLEACFHGFLIFACSTAFYDEKVSDLFEFGVGCYTTIVLVVTARLAIETSCWTWLTHLILWGTVLSYLIFGLIYSSSVWSFSPHGGNLFWIMQRQWISAYAWLFIPIMLVICILPVITLKVFMNELFPTETHIEMRQVNLQLSNANYSISPFYQFYRLKRWWQRRQGQEDAQPIPINQSQSYSSIFETVPHI